MGWLWAELPSLVDDVIAAVGAGVPEYRATAETAQGGVRQALEGFAERAGGRRPARMPVRELSVRFGRAEARRGRPLEAVLRAYRVGAQAAWRGVAEAGDRAGLEPRVLYSLAEQIFAYVDEISAASAEGYTYEQSLAAGEQQERRRRLVEALLGDPQPPRGEVERAARDADWELPERLAVLAFGAEAAERVTARLPAPALVTGNWALVPDPDGPGRHDVLRRAVGDFAAALGPTVAWQRAPERDGRGGPDVRRRAVGAFAAALGPTVAWRGARESARRARLALGGAPSDGLVLADAPLLALTLASAPPLARALAERQLAPLV